MGNTWEFSITGEDGVRLSDDDPGLEAYLEHVEDLARFREALRRW